MKLKEYIKTKIKEYLNEISNNKELPNFLTNKEFQNPKSKRFLYHGTSKNPNEFKLKSDYDWEDSNTWSGDLPEGYLFLTTDINEASSYGKFVIPCELNHYDNITFKVQTDNPSRAFDMDYGIDLYLPDEYVGFWNKFDESGKSVLIIKGYREKSTIITYIENVIPRIDLAKEFYNLNQ